MGKVEFKREISTEWTAVGDGVSRQIMGYDERIMSVKVHFDKGAKAAAHRHPHSQSSVVVSGKFDILTEDSITTLVAGDGFYAAPNALHGVACIDEGVIIDTFSPCREDFLN